MLNFNDSDFSREHFCEYNLYNGEYVNSFSSIFISIAGIIGLIKQQDQATEIYLIHSALIVNGIMSFLYHWYGTIGWGLEDRASMILINMSSVFFIVKQITNLYNMKEIYTKIIIVLLQFYFTTFITVFALQMNDLFNILFAVFFIFLTVYITILKLKRINIRNGLIGVGLLHSVFLKWDTSF